MSLLHRPGGFLWNNFVQCSFLQKPEIFCSHSLTLCMMLMFGYNIMRQPLEPIMMTEGGQAHQVGLLQSICSTYYQFFHLFLSFVLTFLFLFSLFLSSQLPPAFPVSFSVPGLQRRHIYSVISCHTVSDRAVYCSRRWLYSFPAQPGTCSIIMTFVSHVMKKHFLAKTCVWGIANRIFCACLHAVEHNTSPTVRTG